MYSFYISMYVQFLWLSLDISLLCDLRTSKARFRKAGLDKLASHTARYALHESQSIIHTDTR